MKTSRRARRLQRSIDSLGPRVLETNGCRGMSDLVNFSPAVVEDHGRAGVSFMASVDGRPVHCTITALALESYFHADPTRLEASFQSHRDEIEGIADAMIRAGAVRGSDLRIDLADLRSSAVAFAQSVRKSTNPIRRRPQKG
jgi:hypothetical protein